jgi:uncharacterized protein YidB (DUF937 family)
MGLLDSIAQIAGQALSSQNGQGTLVEGVLGMLSRHEGGLAGLVQAFQNKGLGDIAASWVGTGQNLPVSAEQLQQVLGSGALGDLASRFGISPEQVSGHLSQLLPQVVDKLTPDGQLPGGIDLGNALGMLQGLINK